MQSRISVHWGNYIAHLPRSIQDPVGGTRDDAEENEHLASLLPLPPDFVAKWKKKWTNAFVFHY